jgi:preprotein translocase subunit SecD
MEASLLRAFAGLMLCTAVVLPAQAEGWVRLDMVFRTSQPVADETAEVFAARLANRASKPEISISGGDILVSILTQETAEDIAAQLIRKGTFGLHRVLSTAPDCSAVPDELSCFLPTEPTEPAYMVGPAELGNEAITEVTPSFDSNGLPSVNVRFGKDGARRLGIITAEMIGQQIALVVEDRVIIAPRVQSPIYGGSFQITGAFTARTANDLALILASRALPAPVDFISVDASAADPPPRSLGERLLGVFD